MTVMRFSEAILLYLTSPKVLNMRFANVDGNNGISAIARILHVINRDIAPGCESLHAYEL